MVGCKMTKKRRFKTEIDGLKALHKIQKSPRKTCPVRVYQCEFCGGFHLTSKIRHELSITSENNEFKKYMENETENT